jgi:hypothetical protein
VQEVGLGTTQEARYSSRGQHRRTGTECQVLEARPVQEVRPRRQGTGHQSLEARYSTGGQAQGARYRRPGSGGQLYSSAGTVYVVQEVKYITGLQEQ